MTVLIPSLNASWVTPLREEQIQPAGIDLTLASIMTFKGKGLLSSNDKVLPDTEVMKEKNGVFELKQGAFLIRYNEIIHIPENAIGLVFPRSSLMRMGGSIDTAVWDPGYKGRGISLLRVHHSLRLEVNVRIAQLVLFQTQEKPSRLYQGSYQNEGIREKEKD